MTSMASFNDKTEAREVISAFPEAAKGKTVLITGVGPNGLGETLAKILALQQPAILILTGRTLNKVETVIAQLPPGVRALPVQLDVSSFASIKSAIKEINSHVQHIYILVNNAGVMNVPERQLSEDGFEMHLAVNYLGPYLLTTGLMRQLLVSGSSRVVNVGSNGYLFSPFRFADYNFEGKSLPESEVPSKEVCEQYGLPWSSEYTPTIAYGQSKTAILLFTVQLAQLYKEKGLTAICLHPGAIATDLWRHMQKEHTGANFHHAAHEVLESRCEHSSCSSVGSKASRYVLAFSIMILLTGYLDPAGVYMEDCQFASAQHFAKDPAAAERLWDLTEGLIVPHGEA